MTDSDSSEDENLQLLQEAVDTQFTNDNLYKNTPKEVVQDPVKPKSLRISNNEDESGNNILNLTPGVQKYVAKQLENFLETFLSKQLANFPENHVPKKRKRKKSKVKLLSNSEHFIDVYDQDVVTNSVINNNKPKLKTDFDSEDEEKVKSVLVEPEDILSKKDVLNWAKSTRTKQIFRYKKSKKGKVLLEL